jgi:thioredoxin-like negative regulator of GroEL
MIAGAASAGEIRPFDQETFEIAQRDAEPILIEISAPWCPVCRAQKPIIQALAENPSYEGMIVLEVDFDRQKDVVRAFGARSQSTLIMFRGAEETGRSVGDTDPERIEALVAGAFGS